MTKIADDVLQVLGQAKIENGMLKKLPEMPRALYESVNEVLRRLGGKWKGGRTSAHLFDYDFEPVFRAVLESREMPPDNPLDFYATPDPVIEMMLEEAQPFSGAHCGDFSAGMGAIVAHLIEYDSHVTCVELNPINVRVLQDRFPKANVIAGDFLEWKTTERFDIVLLNPPFNPNGHTDGWMEHVTRAHSLLAPGGRLVTITPPSLVFRTDKKFQAFREFVALYGDGWESIEAGAFKSSGTNVATLMLSLTAGKSWRMNPVYNRPNWYIAMAEMYSENNRDFDDRRERLFERFASGELTMLQPHLPGKAAEQEIRQLYAEVSRDTIRNGEPLILTEASYRELVSQFVKDAEERAEQDGVELVVAGEGQLALI